MNDSNSELAPLATKPFLSKILEVEKFRKGQANIIIAPCHSGKTTAIKKIISTHASQPEKVLCLIDTTAGKQAMLTREDAVAYYRRWLKDIRGEVWGEFWDGDGFRVMTYHQFGYEVMREPLFILGIEIIICDEMHNLVKYRGIEKGANKKRALLGQALEDTPCQNALSVLADIAKSPIAPLIVILTATVNTLSVELDRQKVPCAYFDYTDKAHCDLTHNRIYYAHFEDVISHLPSDTRTIVYTSQISQMLEFAKLADNGQRRIRCLWGLHSETYKMSDEQLAIRNTLLKTERIPSDIDLLFINAAYETSININNEDFNTMIIHNSSTDVQIQVRGRLRHDIDTLFIYDPDHKHIAQYFPAEYYNRPLFREDTIAIADIMNLKNKDGRMLKWSSIHELLAKDGVTVTKQKRNGRQCWILHLNYNESHSKEET